MIRYYKINGESRLEPVKTADDAVWIHLESPDEAEMQTTSRMFGFPLDYLHTSLDPDEVSRSEKLTLALMVLAVFWLKRKDLL